MVLRLKLLDQSDLLCYNKQHFLQKTFLILFLFILDITIIKLFMNALFEFYYRTSQAKFCIIFDFDVESQLVLLLYILDLVFVVILSFLFPRSHGKFGLEWLDVKSSFDKFLLFYPRNDSREIIEHIVIINIFIFQPDDTFHHNRSPFLTNIKKTSGETNLILLSRALLSLSKLYLIIVISQLRSIYLSTGRLYNCRSTNK